MKLIDAETKQNTDTEVSVYLSCSHLFNLVSSIALDKEELTVIFLKTSLPLIRKFISFSVKLLDFETSDYNSVGEHITVC